MNLEKELETKIKDAEMSIMLHDEKAKSDLEIIDMNRVKFIQSQNKLRESMVEQLIFLRGMLEGIKINSEKNKECDK